MPLKTEAVTKKERRNILLEYVSGIKGHRIRSIHKLSPKLYYDIIAPEREKKEMKRQEEQECAGELYSQCKTNNEISKIMKLKVSYVIPLLLKAGINNNNHFLNKEKKYKRIAQYYLSGKTANEVAHKFKMDMSRIIAILHYKKVTLRKGKPFEKELVSDFLKNVSISNLMKKFKKNKQSIMRVLRKNNVGYIKVPSVLK